MLTILLAAAAPSSEEYLRRAAMAYAEGDFTRCELLCREAAGKKALLLEEALLLAGQCAFYGGDRKRALEYFTRLSRNFAHGPYARLANLRRADCLWEAGRHREALTLYRREESGDLLSDQAPALWHRLEVERGSTGKVASLLAQLIATEPLHPLIASWPEVLDPQSVAPIDLLPLARALHRARRWVDARLVLDAALGRAGTRLRPRLLLARGLVYFDEKRYREAAADLTEARRLLPPGRERQEAWFFHSRALGRQGDDTGAIAGHLELVKEFPRGPFSPQALFFAGWLEQNRGECAHATEIFQRVVKEYSQSPQASEAAWYAAWCALKEGAWERAFAALERRATAWPAQGTDRALYWQAVAAEALEKKELAHELTARLCRREPFGWYTQRARERFGLESCPPPQLVHKAKPQLEQKDPLLEKAHRVYRTGLESWARQLLWHGQAGFFRRHSGPEGESLLAEAWLSVGDCHQGWRLGNRLLGGREDGRWLRLAFPDCFRKLLEREVAGDSELAAFLLALMNSESGFDQAAHSMADARGLMQLIPPVAAQAAAELGLEYPPEDLFDPEINVRLAVQVVRGLLEKYGRRWWLVAAAYNAGEEAVDRWLNVPAPLDRWTEEIPWEETRRYVMRVSGAMAAYLFLDSPTGP